MQAVVARGRRSVWPLWPLCLLAAGVLLTLNALTAALNHDESQYVAGAVLTARGDMVFHDFMSLQPPLQSWFYAPVVWAFRADSFVALRLTTAALALVALVLLHRAQRIVGVAPAAALVSCGLTMTCGTFLLTGAVVRNDMLAMVLVTAGTAAALAGTRTGAPDRRRWLASGLFFGLAASTKLSFAPYALAATLFLLRAPRTIAAGRLVAYAAGGIAGAAPLLVCAAMTPVAFVWGVLTFASTAPFHWYAAGGMAARLTLDGKAIDLARYALQGPLLPALAIVAVALFSRRLRVAREPLVLLLLLLLAGIAGAAMPTPTQKQYLLPILPPAFILLGAVLGRLPADRGRRAAILVPLAVMALVGLVKPARSIADLHGGEAAALRLDHNAAWIGAEVRRNGDAGDIATLSPDRLAGSGYDVDEDFATGPFVMRSGHLLPTQEALALKVATPAVLEMTLHRDPPAALLTGYEDDRNYRDLDRQVADWALRHGYRPRPLPDRDGTLFVCPGRVTADGCRP